MAKQKFQHNFKDNGRKPATAPYNFVPLNEKHVFVESDTKKELFNGYIDLKVTTLGPVFIRMQGEKMKEINGLPVLPGKTLRGLFRNMVNICAYAPLNELNFEDRRYYRRAIYDKDVPSHPGLIKYDPSNKEYLIYKCSGSAITDYNEKKLAQKVPNAENTGMPDENIWRFYNEFGSNKYYWRIDTRNKDLVRKLSPVELQYYKNDINRQSVDVLKLAENSAFNRSGYPIFYKEDYEIFKKGVAQKIITISHCKQMRLPYAYSTGACGLPALNEKDVSYSQSIFGTSSKSAGKVRVEDLILKRTPGTNVYFTNNPFIPKILQSPRPTAVQMYVQQKGISEQKTKLVTWQDKLAKLRGHKLYWHKKHVDLNSLKYSKNDNQMGKNADNYEVQSDSIMPINRGLTFEGRFVFNGLTSEELGAVLFVLNLPKDREVKSPDYAYKIGLGKPLGLGSIGIESALFLIDHTTRYTSCFQFNQSNELSWLTGNKVPADNSPFISAFESHVLKSIGENSSKKLWDLDRMKQLKRMLSYNESINRKGGVDYMTLAGDPSYMNKNILPNPEDVWNNS